MKNLFNKLFLFALAGSFIFLYSCGEDEPEPTTDAPSIDFSVTGGTLNSTMDTVFVDFGGTVNWTFNITAPGGFNTFRLSGAVTGEFTRTDLGLDAGATSATVSASTGPWDQVGYFTVTATAVDDVDTGQTSSADVVVCVGSPDARVQTAVILYVPTQDEESKTFYSIDLDSLYSINDVEAIDGASPTIDLGYFYVSEANLASPSDYSDAFVGAPDISDWTQRNETKMVASTLTNFVEMTSVADVEAQLANIDFTTSESTVEGLTVGGTIYAFQTAGGLEGFFRVTDLQPGFDQGDNITLEFIIADAAAE